MNKNIIVWALAVLLVLSLVFGVYFFQKSNKAEKLLQDKTEELGLAQNKVNVLGAEKETFQKNVEKGAAYLNSLDLLLEPMRKDMGLATKNLTDFEWMTEFLNSAKATGDKELENLAKDIQKGGAAGNQATLRFIDKVLKSTTDIIK
jgi:prefoldin subunit 5